MELKAVARKWGSSIAVVIPKDLAAQKQIREDDEIVISVRRIEPKAGILFGKFSRPRISTQKIKDEARGGWVSSSDKKRWRL